MADDKGITSSTLDQDQNTTGPGQDQTTSGLDQNNQISLDNNDQKQELKDLNIDTDTDSIDEEHKKLSSKDLDKFDFRDEDGLLSPNNSDVKLRRHSSPGVEIMAPEEHGMVLPRRGSQRVHTLKEPGYYIPLR